MDKLTEYLKASHGRSIALAAALGITPGAVSQWDRVPIERVADVSRITGIPREDLRPDIFASPPEAA